MTETDRIIVRAQLVKSNPISFLYKTLPSILKEFKNLKPVVAKKYIENTLYPFTLEEEIMYNDIEKTLVENKEDIWIDSFDPYYGTQIVKISPHGAAILAELYQKGLFDHCLKGNKSKDTELLKVMEYVNDKKHIEAIYDKYIDEKLRVEEVVDDPSLITVEDFCYKTLDRIFIKEFGLKQGTLTMTLAGAVVSKAVTVYSSNSGKSKSAEVNISWVLPDGEYSEETKGSLYSGNRRNSEDRNWGLPE